MADYSRILLSGSTSGRPIPVAAIATPGTAIHTAVAGAVAWDEIYIWVSNVTAAPAKITIEFGGVSNPGDHLVKSLTIPAYSQAIPIVTGQVLNGGLLIKAFSDVASALNITGHVNRIS